MYQNNEMHFSTFKIILYKWNSIDKQRWRLQNIGEDTNYVIIFMGSHLAIDIEILQTIMSFNAYKKLLEIRK